MDILLNFSFEIQALFMGIFTWLITTLGSALVFFFKKVNSFILNLMMGISAGVMLSASIWSLLIPAIEKAEMLGKSPWLITSIGFFIGAIFLYLMDSFFDKKISNVKMNRNIMLIFSITLHNIPEGLAIGVAFGSLAFEFTKSLFLSAIVLAIGIGLQNFPEGCAVSLPLRKDKMSCFKSFLCGSMSAIVEPISAFIGALMVLKVQSILPFFLSLAAGAMIYVVVKELIPESQKDKNKGIITLFTLLGFVIMMILDVAIG